MRLYLASSGTGDHPECLMTLTGGPGRAVVIANAMDDAPDELRRAAVRRELAAMAALGFEPAELDLRDYRGDQALVRGDLTPAALAWLTGGNSFMLRHALRRSEADTALIGLLAQDSLVYGGNSAGGCVLSPSLRGLEAADDCDAVGRIYGDEPVWEGLGVLDRAFIPHIGSADVPESAALELLAARYQAAGVAHWALRDGQALVIDGESARLV